MSYSIILFDKQMNVVEQILKKELNLSNDMCDRFLELAETKYLKKKEMFVQQGKVCYNLGIIESGVLRSYIEKDAIEFNCRFLQKFPYW